MLVKSYGITDVGLRRDSNEDSFHVQDSLGLYIVADGMGGHLAGEVASHIAVEIISRSYRKWVEEDSDENGIYGEPDESLSRKGNFILGGIRLANRVIYEMAQDRKQYQGMGTTVVVLVVTPTMIIAANVGDSRIYLVRDGELERLSRDHSIVAEQVELGMMTEEEAEASSMKHVLTRNLGSAEDVEPEIFEIEPANNDRFILCSDGLSDLVSDEEILDTAEGSNNPEKLGINLVKKVLGRGAHDNTTIVTLTLSDLKSPHRGAVKSAGYFISDLITGIQKSIKKLARRCISY